MEWKLDRILYGTGNQAKLEAMRRRLAPLELELIGLRELTEEQKRKLPEVSEDGNTPLENARKKALAYYHALGMPVFSCDSGLYLEGVPDSEQPGVHVRTVGGKYLSDEEMLAHYTALASRYGDLLARYHNAICLVLDENHVFETMVDSIDSEPFLLTAHRKYAIRHEGFPLDSISIDIRTGKYFYELEEERVDQVAVDDGFLSFFRKVLG